MLPKTFVFFDRIFVTVFSVCIFICISSCSVQTFSSKDSPAVIALPMYSPLRATSEYPEARYRYVPSDFAISESLLGAKCETIERNYFRVMSRFKGDCFVAQKTNDDCWAASTAMLLNHEFGKNTSYPDIRRQVEGLKLESTSASDGKIYFNMMNSRIGMTYSSPAGSFAIVSSIIQNHPMLAGLEWEGDKTRGHVYVLVGFDFSVGVFGFGMAGVPLPFPAPLPIFDKFYLVDPISTSYEIVAMPAEEFIKRVQFVISFYNIHDSSLKSIKYNTIGDGIEYLRFKASNSSPSVKTKGETPVNMERTDNASKQTSGIKDGDLLGKWRGVITTTTEHGKNVQYNVNYKIEKNSATAENIVFSESTSVVYDNGYIDSCTRKLVSLFVFEGRVEPSEKGYTFIQTKTSDPKCSKLGNRFYKVNGSKMEIDGEWNGRSIKGVLGRVD